MRFLAESISRGLNLYEANTITISLNVSTSQRICIITVEFGLSIGNTIIQQLLALLAPKGFFL